MRPIARSTPDRRHRTAPDEHPDMRPKSADQSMITDVSRLRPHLCTIITSTAPTQIVGGGRRAAPPPLDKGHQSELQPIRSFRRRWRAASAATVRPSALAVLRLITSSNLAAAPSSRPVSRPSSHLLYLRPIPPKQPLNHGVRIMAPVEDHGDDQALAFGLSCDDQDSHL